MKDRSSMISCLGLWTRTVAQYLLGWASILPTTWGAMGVNQYPSGWTLYTTYTIYLFKFTCLFGYFFFPLPLKKK